MKHLEQGRHIPGGDEDIFDHIVEHHGRTFDRRNPNNIEAAYDWHDDIHRAADADAGAKLVGDMIGKALGI